MSHVVVKREFEELIDSWAAVGQVGTGFTFTEGPIWHPVDHYLLFSDMPADVRRRWDQRGGVREVKRPSNKCNGMTYDQDLNLIVCEHATSSLVRESPDGRREVLASHFEGYELNSPNDVCVKSDGAIYFSDPWYGRMPVYGVERPRQLGFQGVYRVPPGGGAPELLVERYMFDQPNGLCFSPDEHRLYVNDTVQALIRVFDVSHLRVAHERAGVRQRHRLGARARRARRHEMRFAWQRLGYRAGRCMGLCAVGRADWQGAGPRDGRQPRLGRTRFPHALHVCHALGLLGQDQGRAAPRAVHARTIRRHCPARGRLRGEAGSTTVPGAASPPAQPAPALKGLSRLDPSRCALIIQDMQNDVVMEGGAFAASGSPAHCKEQNAIANAMRLAEACRRRGVMVIHVWFVVEPGAPGVTLNAPLFEGLVEAKAMVRGTWGAAPVAGLEPQPGDHVVEKMRMSAWEGSSLETVLKSGRRDIVIVTGAWTNMSIEHTARTGADKGYVMIVPEDCCSTMNADWHRASINYALQNVSAVSKADDVIAALG